MICLVVLLLSKSRAVRHAHLVPGVVQMLPDPVLKLFEERREQDHQDDLGLGPSKLF